MMRRSLAILAGLSAVVAQGYTLPPSGNLSITVNSSDGQDEVVSNIPLVCVAGCSDLLTGYLRCNTSSPNTVFCGPFCAPSNYTGWTECLNCIEANGVSEFLMKPISEVLGDSNDLCASAARSSFTPVDTITASPTTTAPLRQTFTETNGQAAITISPWEGLASYADPSFFDKYGKGSSTLAPSASGSGEASAAATTSGAASRSIGRTGAAGGLVAFVLGLAMA